MVRGIQERDAAGSRVASDEDPPPYDRPPLSKTLWKGAPVDRIWRQTGSAGAELRLGRPMVAIEGGARIVRDAQCGMFGVVIFGDASQTLYLVASIKKEPENVPPPRETRFSLARRE